MAHTGKKKAGASSAAVANSTMVNGIEVGTGRPEKYITAGGVRCVGVTTVTGRWGDKGNLIYWGYNRGIADGERRAKGEDEEGLYASRDTAAEVGSRVHQMIEGMILGKETKALEDPELEAWAQDTFKSFRDWWADNDFKVVALEVPLFHEEFAVAGTFDCVARSKTGKLVLLDWKTSSGIYPDYLVQVRAYAWLWEENLRDQIDGFHIVRFSKERNGGMEHRQWSRASMDTCLEQWIRWVQAYRADAKIKAMLR